ncbi:hypothetical protein HDU92_005343 [Lobulomyces angularis]|nr:hypothetical protein HDU92_005343 [Lobulomyces angularis]
MMDTMKLQHKQNSIKEIDLQANKEYSTSNYPYTPISNSDTSSKINNVSPLKSFTFNHNILVAALSLIREMDVISLEVLQVEIDAMLKQKGN